MMKIMIHAGKQGVVQKYPPSQNPPFQKSSKDRQANTKTTQTKQHAHAWKRYLLSSTVALPCLIAASSLPCNDDCHFFQGMSMQYHSDSCDGTIASSSLLNANATFAPKTAVRKELVELATHS
jgi:hypothetical protein